MIMINICHNETFNFSPETAMGQDIKAQENSDSDYVKAVYE